jgi:putative nucleotidyltransferase with HDIG domain
MEENSLAVHADTIVDKGQLSRVIESELEDLPTLPSVVIRVMETVNNPATSAADIKELISADQALTAKILRLVNSSYYGFPGKITTITHAVVILGFSTIRNLAISLGVANGFGPSSKIAALDGEEFWSHCVAVAYASALIARRKNATNRVLEEVFIGGLLHDIGKLFLDKYFPNQYNSALQIAQTHSISIREAEIEALGVDHTAIGKKVGEKWNLPPATVSMIAMHHDPGLVETHFDSIYIIHAADCLARNLKLGNAGDSLEPVLSPEVEEWLKFSPAIWETLELDTIKKFEGASEFLKEMLSN